MSKLVIIQDGWRLCNLCSCLVFNPNSSNQTGYCALAQPHETGDKHYRVYFQHRSVKGQHGWRWCWKCEAMFFNGHPTKGVCPADGGWHDGSESGKYELLHSKTPLAFYDWRWCNKCEQILVEEFGGQACPKGEKHDWWGSYGAENMSGWYYIEESPLTKEPDYAERDPNTLPKVPEWM